jgi:hypothetical protein
MNSKKRCNFIINPLYFLMRMDRLLTADRGLPAAADLSMLIMLMFYAAIRGHLPIACMICRSVLEGVGFKYYRMLRLKQPHQRSHTSLATFSGCGNNYYRVLVCNLALKTPKKRVMGLYCLRKGI